MGLLIKVGIIIAAIILGSVIAWKCLKKYKPDSALKVANWIKGLPKMMMDETVGAVVKSEK